MHRWMMVFNTDKCEVLQISLSNLTPANYYLYNNQLRHVEEATVNILAYYWISRMLRLGAQPVTAY